HLDSGAIIWPLLINGIGLGLLMDEGRSNSCSPRPNTRKRFGDRQRDFEWDKRVKEDDSDSPAHSGATANSDATRQDKGNPLRAPDAPADDTKNFTNEDYLNSTAIFSDVKKIVISKRFQGGEIVNVCGGTDVNLIQADIQQPIVIDVFQLFAGMKIIVPAHW